MSEYAETCSATATSSHGGQEVAAEADLGREADGVEDAVEAPPPPLQLGSQGGQVGRVGHVELEDVGLGRQPPGRPLR